MTIADFKRVAQVLKKVYAELETQALKEGIELLSPEYATMQAKAREMVLQKAGFTLDEYRNIRDQVTGITKAGAVEIMQNTKKIMAEVQTKLDQTHIPTRQEIIQIAHEVARNYIKPPQITNQIIKETTIEKPQIIKQTTVEKVIEEKRYNDQGIKNEIASIQSQIKNIPVQTPIDIEKFKEEMRTHVDATLAATINILGMPDFRKLALGLRQDIDSAVKGIIAGSNITITSSGGIYTISASAGGGSSFLTATGTVNGINLAFTFTSAPSVIFVDGAPMQKTSSDGTSNWSGTTSVTLSIAPSFDVFGLG